ncbi:hypothetical protein ASG11_10590 [Sphingomonas sp. Leaf357]|uniref:hypothetical protein n=1 Tax=Sphingomonas sp. Leaf357 TaxID=1736350 RepID=UPI0007000349|nr:hypothetical protein [Sphingomonas sp. Leaf357]KQS04643.1 hypothetical protein ASG11_10590 [Sphingomonas sp. Leaf357]
MRRLISLALIAPLLAPSAVDAAARRTVLDTKCGSEQTLVGDPVKPLKAKPLGREPSAAQILAVYRNVDGCPQPVVLREGIGIKGNARPALKAPPKLSPLR